MGDNGSIYQTGFDLRFKDLGYQACRCKSARYVA